MRVSPHWKPTAIRLLSLPSADYIIGSILFPYDAVVYLFYHLFALIISSFPRGKDIFEEKPGFLSRNRIFPFTAVLCLSWGVCLPIRTKEKGLISHQDPPKTTHIFTQTCLGA